MATKKSTDRQLITATSTTTKSADTQPAAVTNASHHDGHRDRLRAKVAANGIESLALHEVLEFLLYSVIPRKDTNEIAHDLIASFGSLAAVIDADIDRLVSVKGMTYNAAVMIHSLAGTFRTYTSSKYCEKIVINSREELTAYIHHRLSSLTREEVHLLCKDAAGRLINDITISKGTIDKASLFVREVMDAALRVKAMSVILVHNHPSHSCTPSPYDLDITYRIGISLATTEIRLDDHVIIAGNNQYSFKLSGKLDSIMDGGVRLKFTNNCLSDIKF